jgi:hypothetical protein
MMKNLFVIYIGGSHKRALIELHDIRLIIAEAIEDTYDELKKSWWGDPKSLHLDAWGILHSADGYNIEIVDSKPQNQQAKLYFVNLGGYDSRQFTELHKNIFIVAENDQDAKSRALKHIKNWESPHKDYLFEVDKVLNVSDLLSNKIKLTPCSMDTAFEFVCKYVPIGKL